MSSKKRNKPYRPTILNANPLSPHLSAVEINGLKHLAYVAMTNLGQKTGTQRHWCDLACRLVVGRKIVMEYFKEQEIAAQIHRSVARLVQIYHFEGTKPNGTWELLDFDLLAIRDCLELIDDVLPVITRKEYNAIYTPIATLQINALVKEDCTWEEYLESNARTK